MDAVTSQLKEQIMPEAKRDSMLATYAFIRTDAFLTSTIPGTNLSPLHKILTDIEREVWPFWTTYTDIDVLGHFYGEFLKYTDGESKLGIVLTPRHVTELFSELADLTT